MEDAGDASGFSVGEARSIVSDLFMPNPLLYWVDFTASITLGALAFVLVPQFGLVTPWAAVLFTVSVLSLYRAAVFIHEVIHLRKGSLPWFPVYWNVLCGIPMLIPSFLYQSHWDHHAKRHYGRSTDAEYVPFTRRPPRALVWFVAASAVVPLIVLARFVVLAPLAWSSHRMRKLVDERASALKIDIDFVWRQPTTRERRLWTLQEAACLLYVLTIAGLLAFGVVSPFRILQAYVTFVALMAINSVRLLGAHRYRGDEEEMTFVEQMLDSINYPQRGLLADVWAPVGLRWHALHHLFAGIPYHSLRRAHDRLMAELPAGSPYRLTSSPSLRASLTELWRASANSQHSASAGTLVEPRPRREQ